MTFAQILSMGEHVGTVHLVDAISRPEAARRYLHGLYVADGDDDVVTPGDGGG
jgi:hypothetical protein